MRTKLHGFGGDGQDILTVGGILHLHEERRGQTQCMRVVGAIFTLKNYFNWCNPVSYSHIKSYI